MNQGSSSLKTIGIIVVCVAALAAAIWSGYRSFVPQGHVTHAKGTFGSRDADKADSKGNADALAGAPPNIGPPAETGK